MMFDQGQQIDPRHLAPNSSAECAKAGSEPRPQFVPAGNAGLWKVVSSDGSISPCVPADDGPKQSEGPAGGGRGTSRKEKSPTSLDTPELGSADLRLLRAMTAPPALGTGSDRNVKPGAESRPGKPGGEHSPRRVEMPLAAGNPSAWLRGPLATPLGDRKKTTPGTKPKQADQETKPQGPPPREAETRPIPTPPSDARLAQLVQRWERLPEAIKKVIVALVDTEAA